MLDFATAFLPEHMTLKSNLMRCFDRYINDVIKKTGTTIEVAYSVLTERDGATKRKGSSEQCWAGVYDPWL
jgi:hypothetical protein